MVLMSPLILHVPHASALIPATDRADYLLSEAELAAEGLRLVDAHTDALFGAERWPGAVLAAAVSRLVVDVERFADDAREPCARVGMGATYVRASDGRPLRDLSAARRAELLESYYTPHHATADRLARERLAAGGRCLVLDAHSYPVAPLPTEVAAGRPEIGLGTDGVHTSPELRDLLATFFRDRGYDVAVDAPFTGAFVPNACFGRDPRCQAIMVEVRRDLYMDEATGARHAGFGRVRADLLALHPVLADFAARPVWPT
jgi:N-formylglutamate amidohydrolase